MKLLLDTQTFLWYVLDDPQLSEISRSAIEGEEVGVLVERQRPFRA